MDTALELVIAQAQTCDFGARAGDENRVGSGGALRSRGHPATERWDESAAIVNDLGKRVSSSAFVLHSKFVTQLDRQKSGHDPPGWVSNRDTRSHRVSWDQGREQEGLELGHGHAAFFP